MLLSSPANTRPINRNGLRRFLLLPLTTLGVLVAVSAFVQQKADFAGDYTGTLGPIHVKLHIVVGADGSVNANVDSPEQQLFGLPCTSIQINGPALSFVVPNVKGEWTGVMSADGKSLNGVWKQGTPMALNFTRGESALGNAIAPPNAPRQAVNLPAVASPPCAAIGGASYWDGSAWKTMVIAAHLGREQGASVNEGLKAMARNPFNSRAGLTNILTFKNPSASLTLAQSPKFCVYIPANMDPTVVMIGSIEVKNDHRELETCAGRCASKGRNSDDWMPEKNVRPVDVKRITDNTVEVTLKSPLKPGQYILGGPPLIGYYDFGVGEGAPTP